MPFTLHQFSKNTQSKFSNDDACKITYSQFGEDAIIFNILTTRMKKTDAGFYVDIGAFHPRLFSNTKILSIMGWSGINIDANKDSIDLFNKERPNDINICCGVAPTDGELTYHKFSNNSTINITDAVNTFSPERAKKLQDDHNFKLDKTISACTVEF